MVQVLGLVDRGLYFELLDSIGEAAPARVLGIVAQAVDEGVDIEEFVYGLVELLRHLLFVKIQGGIDELDMAEDARRRCGELAAAMAAEDLLRMMQSALGFRSEYKALGTAAFPRGNRLGASGTVGPVCRCGRAAAPLAGTRKCCAAPDCAPASKQESQRTGAPHPQVGLNEQAVPPPPSGLNEQAVPPPPSGP